MYFVDTNIFIHILTKNDPVKSPACLAKLQQISEAGEQLYTIGEVLAEITYILRSKRHPFQLTHGEISARLRQILNLDAIQVPDKSVYKRAADIFEEAGIDFEDCAIVAQMERNKLRELLSYDRHFERFEHITRLEPKLTDCDVSTA